MRMRRNQKRLLAELLSVVLCISSFNISAYAQENAVTENTVSVNTTTVSGSDATVSGNDVGEDTGEAESSETDWDGITMEKAYEGKNYKITYILTSYWNNGYNAAIKLENTGTAPIEDWYLAYFSQDTIDNIWSAEINSKEEDFYVIKNLGWNQKLEAGGVLEFGLSSNQIFNGFPEDIRLLGTTKNEQDEVYSVEYYVNSDWGDGFSGGIRITNNSDTALENWVLEFDFDRELNNIWNAIIESHKGSHYVIVNTGYNADIAAGQVIDIGFQGEQGRSEDVPYNYTVKSNNVSLDFDTDEDGIVDRIEIELGLDYKNPDTDGDGLTDYEELYLLRTDPLKPDTDDNGILDPDEDLDGDGITNKEELSLGTNPANSDTDGDGLTDYEELYTYQCDPLNEDTDGDGLSDYDDVVLGFSPLLQDTDGNGILDRDEKLYQSIAETFNAEEGHGLTEVSVSMNVSGNIEKNVGILNVYEFDTLSRDVVGLVGVPVEINSNVAFDTAVIRFTYDETALGDVKEENLSVLWYDEANDWYQILDRESVIDKVNNTVSLTTTHFSTYMLVDKESWFEAWRENIDYRISQNSDIRKKHCFDISFVLDISGSMYGTRIDYAKKAMNGFLDSLLEYDSAALITFTDTATIQNAFTNDFVSVANTVRALSANGGTNVNAGLLKALEAFNKKEAESISEDDIEHEKIIVLICDGDVNYYQSTINTCIAQGIKIYAVNVQYTASNYYLETMAEQTGGQYYYSSSEEDLVTKFVMIQNTILDIIDPTDTDGDGLYDIYETAGMKLSNGTVIYTDPHRVDTDGDGLTDFEETGLVYNVDDRYIGNNVPKTVKYFQMYSNPTKKDTDGDTILDADDSRPWEKDYIYIELDNKYAGCEFLNIVDEDGNVAPGGNQGWWKEKVENEDMLNARETKYEYYQSDINYRIWRMGCGVIAMTDTEVYLVQQNEGYNFIYPTSDDTLYDRLSYNKITGAVDKSRYMEYALYNTLNTYKLRDDGLQFKVGVYPWEMASGIGELLLCNGNPDVLVMWAPFALHGKVEHKEVVIKRIEEMLKQNLPVVCSYDDKELLYFYDKVEDAINQVKNKDECDSHYMTIIGMCKYIKDDGIGYNYILKVATWGKIYYINYDEYSEKLDFFSNILSIWR